MITIKGNPISVNSLYRGRRFLTNEGKQIKESYAWEVKGQWRQKMLLGSVKLTIKAYFGTKRPRDLDNIAKALNDSLTGIVFKDDSQIDELHIYRFYSKENPRVEIYVN